jgi:hypothetical protein
VNAARAYVHLVAIAVQSCGFFQSSGTSVWHDTLPLLMYGFYAPTLRLLRPCCWTIIGFSWACLACPIGSCSDWIFRGISLPLATMLGSPAQKSQVLLVYGRTHSHLHRMEKTGELLLELISRTGTV